ncbi:putative sodium channel and clathrin linker 1 isoform X3 [Penaeus vannamei]|uniref:Putative sodium channel and clathrin linker 1 isoform X3 n=1 Tax=Penaeus vannamei TaxID=6689 RepID=A0A3R7SMU8_PENVA|nr:putative sodium channel and clathrin linker 1 isoform X3 [Penaeus vannamei]
MEKEYLIKDYEEAVRKQALLIARQQALIDDLREELSTQQTRSASTNKENQKRIEALLQQIQSSTIQESGEEILLLKKEVETAQKEKELCQAENSRQTLEIERLQQELVGLQSATSDAQIPLQGQFSDEYAKVVEALEEETNRLRAELNRLEDEKIEILKVNIGLKKTVSSIETTLEQEVQKNQILKSTLEERGSASQEIRDSYRTLNAKFLEQSEDLRTLIAQTEALQKSKDQMTKVLSNVKEKLNDAQKRVADSLRIAEDSLVEKDAALLREKHALNEVRRLESTVASLMEEAGQKAKAEVNKIKDDYNANIKKLSQEVAQLEMKQLECDRSLRERKKMAEEVERLMAELCNKKEQHRAETLNLHDRINILESKITNTIAEKKSVSDQNVLSMREYEQQKEELFHRIQELEQRLSTSRSECEALRLECEEIRSANADATATLERAKEDGESSEKFLKRQLRLKTEELEELSSSSRVRLDALNSTHQEVVTQLQDNIASLQESYTRLQVQMNDQRKESELKMSEVSRRLQECQSKSQQLVRSLHEASTNLAIARDLNSHYEKRIQDVEDRLRASEKRFVTLRSGSRQDEGLYKPTS